MSQPPSGPYGQDPQLSGGQPLPSWPPPPGQPQHGRGPAAREHLAGTGMTSRADTPAPGMAYVKFVSDPGQGLRADSDVPIMARAVATLQFRPESGRWLVHQLGDYCLPENLPIPPAAG